jgi:hypothetical protein
MSKQFERTYVENRPRKTAAGDAWGGPMTLPTLPQSLPQLVIDALQAAAAVGVCGESPKPRPGGRPPKYADSAARKRAYRRRGGMRDETTSRDKTRDETLVSRDETRDETHVLSLEEVKAIHETHETPAPLGMAPPCDETSSVTRGETTVEARRMALGPALRGRLEEAGQGHFDQIRDKTRHTGDDLLQALCRAGRGNFDISASFEPIRALLDQGCDLEADVVPIVAREVPELPRPLKNWGAPWLVREILAAREQRLAGHRVEAPPPARRTRPPTEAAS